MGTHFHRSLSKNETESCQTDSMSFSDLREMLRFVPSRPKSVLNCSIYADQEWMLTDL